MKRRYLVNLTVVIVVIIGFGVCGCKKEEPVSEQQAKRLQAVVSFLTDDVLASIDPAKAKGRGVTGLDVLDAASENLDDVFEGEPLLEASVRHSLGSGYHRLGYYEAAEPHLKGAFEIRRKQLGEDHPDTLTSMMMLGWLYLLLGRYDESESFCVKALDGRRRILGEDHPDTLKLMHTLGALYRAQRRYNEAELIDVNGIEKMCRVLGDEHPETLYFMSELGWLYLNQGRYDQAETQFVKSLEILRRVLSDEHPVTLDSMTANAVLYMSQ
jgi:tetratricopeptide (TPR) repeat protein